MDIPKKEIQTIATTKKAGNTWSNITTLFIIFLLFVSGIWLYSLTSSTLIPKRHDMMDHQQHGLKKRVRTKCNAIKPCDCYQRKKSCLCAMGSDIGEGCIEKTCSWIVNDQKKHTGQCRECSPRDCEACMTNEKCRVAGDNNNFCKWMEDIEGGDSTCQSICSIYNCNLCNTYERCHTKSTCTWDGKQCHAKCSDHNCHGCDTRKSCENTAHACLWDEKSEFCTMPGLVSNVKNGFGCWTVDTIDLCQKAVSTSGEKCKWSTDDNTCTGENSEMISPYHGNAYNVDDMQFERIDRVAGNLMLESTSCIGSNCNYYFAIQYDKWSTLQVVYGDLYIRHNKYLEELSISEMTFIHGNVYLEDNPKLAIINYNENLIIHGCVEITECPNLTAETINFFFLIQDKKLCK